MIKARSMEVLEVSDDKGLIGKFSIDGEWEGFRKLKELSTGNIMIAAPVDKPGIQSVFSGLFADIFFVELTNDITVIAASPDLAARISEGRAQARDKVIEGLENKAIMRRQNITQLEIQISKMRDAMQTFCDQVDASEVRSVHTYKQFKELLK